VPARAVVFPELGHSIPLDKRGPLVSEFLTKHLKLKPAP
jgi:hypothetical protein